MTKMPCRAGSFLMVVLLNFATADPGPNQLFREYSFTKVISPYIGPNLYKTEFSADLNINDLDQAIRAEVALQFWGGHIGTSDQAFRVNRGTKMKFPQPTTPGSPFCYYRTLFGRQAVEIPLVDLRTGANQLTFYCGPQVCYGFNWPHYWLYAFTVRVYYQSTVAHASGFIDSPASGRILGENPIFHVQVDTLHVPVESVDLIASYMDFDWEGDGSFTGWHYTMQSGQWKNQVGTTDKAPYLFSWNTEWVPDQAEPVQVMARIKGRNGICYTTPVVDGLTLSRPGRSVQMYACNTMPQNFSARANKRNVLYIPLPAESVHASRACLMLSTWSARTDDNSVHEIGLNNERLADNFGAFHDYSFNRIEIPTSLLRPGDNQLYIYSQYSGHALEINWPGPVILLEYLRDNPVNETPSETAAGFTLAANYPNPFNQSTTFSFQLSTPAFLSLQIYNQNGQLVKTVMEQTLPAGKHRALWQGRDEDGIPASDGVYFARLVAGAHIRYTKMLLIK